MKIAINFHNLPSEEKKSLTEEAIESAISGMVNSYVGFGSTFDDAFEPLAKSITDLTKKSSFASFILKQLVKAWGKNAFEEGIEEGVQDNITSLVKKLTYKKDAEWFSLTDSEAVINPLRSGQAMAMGGGILGSASAVTAS